MANIKSKEVFKSSGLGALDRVVSGGYCIGCGACTAVTGSPIRIRLNDIGEYQAYVDTNSEVDTKDISAVCPFTDESLNEDQIGKKIFDHTAVADTHLGYHLRKSVGYVSESGFRSAGSSGGFGKWILCELLRLKMVDAVIQVATSNADTSEAGMLYDFRVFRTPEEILSQGSKSVYYPVEMSKALKYIRENPGKYAITGVPCFVRAIRNLSIKEAVFAERITYCVGLVCGHLKSTGYADMMGWQLGVTPGAISYIDFRKKLPGTNAKEKGVEVRSSLAEDLVRGPEIVQKLFGTDYNDGFFQYNACDYCDDVVGETADISVGDAWLPEYIKDGRGTSLVIVRNKALLSLLENAEREGRVTLKDVTREEVLSTQSGGFRQRREGLAYRLALKKAEGEWCPTKRVTPSKRHINKRRRKIYDYRIKLSQVSHQVFSEAVKAGDFSLFRTRMDELLQVYRSLYRLTFMERIQKGIMRRINRYFK